MGHEGGIVFCADVTDGSLDHYGFELMLFVDE